MVPKIIARGRSFKGAATYLLHDKERAASADRVAWTEARNLAVDVPDQAWRVMTATAMDQQRLKDQAGIKSTGRKSDQPVLHISLAWHPEEQDKLSQAEMKRAAIGALKALGADDRQALIIAHNDEAHPHLHILCNRVSPEDGRMLSSSKEKLNLSRWAETYERERGKIYCEDRVLNNEARDHGIYTRGKKPKSRREVEQVARVGLEANDNDKRVQAFLDEQRKLDAALVWEGRDLGARHGREWTALREDHVGRQAHLTRIEQKANRRASDVIASAYGEKRRALFSDQQKELALFENREQRLSGKIQNALQAINYARHVRGEDRGATIGDAFKFLSSTGAREQALLKRQEQDRSTLIREQKGALNSAGNRLTEIRRHGLLRLDQRLVQESDALRLQQEDDRNSFQEKWHSRGRERMDAYREFAEKQTLAKDTQAGFNEASRGIAAREKADRVKELQALIKARLKASRTKDRDGQERE